MDALQALLGAKPVTEITEEFEIKRLGAKFTIKALTGEDIDTIRENSTYPAREGKKTVLKLNENEFAQNLVVSAVVNPNFNNDELKAHYKATDGGDCVKKALLAGEITALQTAVLSLSGFGDFDEDVEHAKN